MKKITQLFIAFAVSLMLTGIPPLAAQTTDADLQNALGRFLEARQNFKDDMAEEAGELAQVSRDRSQFGLQQTQQGWLETQERREDHRKNVLLSLIDIQTEYLNRTKDRVGQLPDVGVAFKTQLSAEIDKGVQKLNDGKIKAQGAATPEELNNAAKDIRNIFASYHGMVSRTVDPIHSFRLMNAIGKAGDRSTVIGASINDLKAAGKDTKGLEADLSDAEKRIDDARKKVGRGEFREASGDLMVVYQKFRGIAGKANSL